MTHSCLVSIGQSSLVDEIALFEEELKFQVTIACELLIDLLIDLAVRLRIQVRYPKVKCYVFRRPCCLSNPPRLRLVLKTVLALSNRRLMSQTPYYYQRRRTQTQFPRHNNERRYIKCHRSICLIRASENLA